MVRLASLPPLPLRLPRIPSATSATTSLAGVYKTSTTGKGPPLRPPSTTSLSLSPHHPLPFILTPSTSQFDAASNRKEEKGLRVNILTGVGLDILQPSLQSPVPILLGQSSLEPFALLLFLLPLHHHHSLPLPSLPPLHPVEPCPSHKGSSLEVTIVSPPLTQLRPSKSEGGEADLDQI